LIEVLALLVVVRILTMKIQGAFVDAIGRAGHIQFVEIADLQPDHLVVTHKGGYGSLLVVILVFLNMR
jgi:hypothetical protein